MYGVVLYAARKQQRWRSLNGRACPRAASLVSLLVLAVVLDLLRRVCVVGAGQVASLELVGGSYVTLDVSPLAAQQRRLHARQVDAHVQAVLEAVVQLQRLARAQQREGVAQHDQAIRVPRRGHAGRGRGGSSSSRLL